MHPYRRLCCFWLTVLATVFICTNRADSSLAHPQLIESHVTDVAMLEEVSKFRSAAGHDFSYDPLFAYGGEYFGATDSTEPPSSMKHYLAPYAAHLGDQSTVPIYSPFDGAITRVTEEVNEDNPSIVNKRVEITSSDNPAYTLVVFHMDLDEDYPQILNDWPAAVWPAHQPDDASYVTDTLSAGDLMGYADMRTGHDFDVAVLYSVTSTEKYWVSYFDLMPDSLFSTYSARDATRELLSISKAERIANPITSWSSGSSEDWVALRNVPESSTFKLSLFCMLFFVGRLRTRD